MRSKKNQKIIVRAIDPNTPKMHVEWQKITQTPPKTSITMTEVAENVDFYIENGYFVFTEKYLIQRGYCCENGCRHCPYK